MKCFLKQGLEVKNNLKKQNTNEKEDHSMQEPVENQKEEMYNAESMLVLKDNEGNKTSIDKIIPALETEYKGAHFIKDSQKRTVILSCNLCDKLFSNSAKMRQHTIECLDENSITIEESGYQAPIIEPVVSEEVDELSEPVLKVEMNGVESPMDAYYTDGGTRIIKQEVDTLDDSFKDFQCCLCSKVYHKKYSLREHMRTIHAKKESVCDVCSKIFENRRYLKVHITNIHSNSATSLCDQCEKEFGNKKNLNAHILYVHKTENVSCEKCGKEYRNRTILLKHIRKSSCSRGIDKRRKLKKKATGGVCDQCQKKVQRLERHKKFAHNTSGTLYPCQHCNKEFVSNGRLGLHINSVHVVDQVSCEKCKKVYKNKIILQKHLSRAHKDIKYSCNKCEYQATYQCALKRHKESIHEGIKYSCDQCLYQTSQQSHLREHQKLKHF